MNDPVRGCDVYKNIGCSHVDGFLCDYPDCSILKKYTELIVLECAKTIESQDVDPSFKNRMSWAIKTKFGIEE